MSWYDSRGLARLELPLVVPEEAGAVPGGGVVELYWLPLVLLEPKFMPERLEMLPTPAGFG